FVDDVLVDPTVLDRDTEGDEYLVDGQRLVAVGGVLFGLAQGAQEGETFPAWANGCYYFRTERDDGSRYFFCNSGKVWIVQTKSGHLLQFGDPNDTLLTTGTERLSTTGVFVGGPTSINPAYKWNLVRDSDASGNTVYYAYDTLQSLLPAHAANPGALYLTDIYDTPRLGAPASTSSFAHHTHVTWELPSPVVGPLLDPLWRAVPFARVHRVDVTTIRTTCRVLVRSYLMSYLWNDWGTQYYLSKIETHGMCGTSAAPDDIIEPFAYVAACPMLTSTSYAYTAITGASQTVLPTIGTSGTTDLPSPTVTTNGKPSYAFMDLDGDGRSDLLQGPNPTLAFLEGSSSVASLTMSQNNPSGLKATIGDLYS
ncbi:MAG: hypothetical protein ACREJ3_06040, partial [Polyangiaceae bacterium]